MDYNELLSTKLSILVVESDERILKRLSIWVKAIASEIHVYSSPLEALDLLDTVTVDIVIFSSDMNHMGSMEFLEKVKQIDPKQVSVMMIEEINMELFKESIFLGVDKYLNRPIDAKILIQVIEELAVEKVFQLEFVKQNKLLGEYKEAIDKSFAVSVHHNSGDIDFVNDAFNILFKCQDTTASKDKFNPLYDENEQKYKDIWQKLDIKEIYRGRKEYLDSTGARLIVDVNVIPILNNENEIDEYIAFINDVTEVVQAGRKLTEEKLHRLEDLKSHNQEMDKAKDSFLTVFTHELRTPLNAIINFSQHSTKHVVKEEFSKKEMIVSELQAINESGIYILDMINNVMDAVKLRDESILFTMRDISLKNSLESVIERLSYLSKERKITFLMAEDCTLHVDDSRFLQIFSNLISNALKYSKSEVKVFAKANESKFGIVIEDDGEGIDDASKIFELFEQLSDDEMTRTASGIGVGMYIVKQLCDAFGYNITIDKSPKLFGAKISITGLLKANNGSK